MSSIKLKNIQLGRDPVATNNLVIETPTVADGSLKIRSGILGGVGTDRLVLSASGNVGLGVTPSAWDTLKSLDISTWASFAGFTNQVGMLGNAYFDGSVYRYKQTAVATRYEQNNTGNHLFFTAPSGTAGNPITFTQAMALGNNNRLELGTNASTENTPAFRVYRGGGNPNYIELTTTGGDSRILAVGIAGTAANLIFSNAASGGGVIERARITAAGNLLVGATTDTSDRIRATDGSGNMFITGQSIAQNRSPNSGAVADAGAFSQQITLGAGTGAIQFLTSSAVGGTVIERTRITSAGYLKVSNTGIYGNVAGTADLSAGLQHVFQNDQNSATVAALTGNTGAAVRNMQSLLATGATGLHFQGVVNTVSVFQVLANGDVRNTNNSYGAISDIKLKENITDATPKLEQLNQLRVVNYNLISNPELKQIGLIAQEVEQVFPGLVDETPDIDPETNEPTGTVTKSVKYSVLVPMLLKAVQELTARIEELEANKG